MTSSPPTWMAGTSRAAPGRRRGASRPPRPRRCREDFGAVMAGRLAEQARAVEDRAALRIGRAEIEPADARQRRSRRRTSRRARASPTSRSRRAVTCRAPPPAARNATISAWAVGSLSRASGCARRASEFAAAGDDRADRHLAVARGAAGLLEREPHRLGKRERRLIARWPCCRPGRSARRPARLGPTVGTWTLAVVVPTSTFLVSIATAPLALRLRLMTPVQTRTMASRERARSREGGCAS